MLGKKILEIPIYLVIGLGIATASFLIYVILSPSQVNTYPTNDENVSTFNNLTEKTLHRNLEQENLDPTAYMNKSPRGDNDSNKTENISEIIKTQDNNKNNEKHEVVPCFKMDVNYQQHNDTDFNPIYDINMKNCATGHPNT